MKFFTHLFLFLNAALILTVPAAAGSQEFSGHLALQARVFPREPIYAEQHHHNGSVSFLPEYYSERENGSSLTVTPFIRLDSADDERSHFDIRELNYLFLGDDWEVKLGISKVFWGATEFVHLVDIINQTDLVEAIDNEEKLGQPMVHFSTPQDWGVLDFFILPWFRERSFPGLNGRLRTALVVDTDHTAYESGKEERHLDFALRYSTIIGGMDTGIYHFIGTGREPTLQPVVDGLGRPLSLRPFYEQIGQTGLDLQLAAGNWLWKLEALYRAGLQEDFFATTGGFEYTLVGLGDTGFDLGLIGEFVYDERGVRATTPFNNDVMFGLRLTLNDAASSELLAGIIHDTRNSARTMSLEASRRFGDNIKASLEAYLFSNQPEEDLLYSLRHDDYISLEFAYYF